MSIDQLSEIMQPAIESQLSSVVERVKDGSSRYAELHHMMSYHLGWEGAGASPSARGKRIRPLLLLLTTSAAGGDWVQALPAAAAVELIHNFSLIHDDIEDQSPLRRGRQTIWKLWGIAQAINTGDCMFTLAHLSILDLEQTATKQISLHAARTLQKTCLQLTQGQFLDIAYENHADLVLEDYWPMIEGKTAALLSACTHIGAVVAGTDDIICERYAAYGRSLGLAFQAQDDLLGIWGNAALTGKSTESDLVSGKKSLPVLYGLRHKGAFAQRWVQGLISAEEVGSIAHQLEVEGAKSYCQETAAYLTDQALQALAAANPAGEAGDSLVTLTQRLLNRQV